MTSDQIITKLRHIIETIYPTLCVGCGRFGVGLCDLCVASLPVMRDSHCLSCHKKLNPHLSCVCGSPRVYSLYKYKHPLNNLVRAFKFTQRYETLAHMVRNSSPAQLARITGEAGDPTETHLAPIPQSAKESQENNVSLPLVLAHTIALVLGVQVAPDALRKTKDTPKQTSLSREDRLTNLAGAFELGAQIEPAPNTIVLVDDVATTGATLLEATRTIKKRYKNTKIIALTIANDWD